jgi:hypothetical protein
MTAIPRKLRPALLGALAGLAFAAGCADGPAPTDLLPDDEVPAGAVRLAASSIQTVASEPYSGVRERRREVLADREAWEALWAEIYATIVPRPEVPGVDFSDHVLVGLAMGRRATGGFSIEVEAVHRQGDELWVTVVERSPGPSCLLTQAPTSPVTVVRVPRTVGPLHLVERQETTGCS